MGENAAQTAPEIVNTPMIMLGGAITVLATRRIAGLISKHSKVEDFYISHDLLN